jgi:ABC-type transport system involved in multi-copper enzyme maturation permease subunit
MTKLINEHEEKALTPLPREMAPSLVRPDEPRLARILGTIGLFLVVLAGAVLLVPSSGFSAIVGPFWRTLLMSLGIACLLYHAARDDDMQVRRTYGLLGFVLLAAAALVSALPIGGPAGTQFLPFGFTFLMLALLFLMAFLRTEDDQTWRTATTGVFVVVGAALALAGFIGGNVSENFLLPYGVLLALAGLAYLWAFIGAEGTSTNLGYRTAMALGAVGAVVGLVALGRSILPQLFHSLGWITARPDAFLVPSGLTLLAIALLYLGLAVGSCSDNRLIVLTRRELAAYFYSPMAYLVLIGFSAIAWFLFLMFVGWLQTRAMRHLAVPEPIIARYLLQWEPIIILVILGIPVLTMRLLSEEQRTGTLEVLLTAPVSETSVVLSKFLAVFLFYLVLWLPWALCLVALRVGTGLPFEFRPLLAFFLAVACTGAGFLAMGLFFSSLSRNQLIAAVLTAVGILFATTLYFVKGALEEKNPGSTWITIINHMSYIDLWILSAGEGSVAPRYLMFHLSAAVFWLFLTVKVLESRKWR